MQILSIPCNLGHSHVNPFGRPFVKRFALWYRTPLYVCPACPVCDVGVLWLNGWMDQDATWHADILRPLATLCYMGIQLPQKGDTPPIFGPRLLWPNGWMDQDATWYGGRPRPRRHCVRWGPRSSQKGGTAPNYRPCLLWRTVAHLRYC